MPGRGAAGRGAGDAPTPKGLFPGLGAAGRGGIPGEPGCWNGELGPGRVGGRSPPGAGRAGAEEEPAAGPGCGRAAGGCAGGACGLGGAALGGAVVGLLAAALGAAAGGAAGAGAGAAAPRASAAGGAPAADGAAAAPDPVAAGFAADLAAALAGDLAAGKLSRSLRTTGASTVDDALLTNSPSSLSLASTSLLGTPSSFASSCTRALPATGLLVSRPAGHRSTSFVTGATRSSLTLHCRLIRIDLLSPGSPSPDPSVVATAQSAPAPPRRRARRARRRRERRPSAASLTPHTPSRGAPTLPDRACAVSGRGPPGTRPRQRGAVARPRRAPGSRRTSESDRCFA
jgi:hypothetical protein